MGFILGMQGWFKHSKSNINHHINKPKKGKHMIILINIEKAFEKIHCPFLIKILNKPGTEGNFFNLIKVIYRKPTADIILNAETLLSFSCQVRNKVKISTSRLLFNIQPELGGSSQIN